MNQEITPGSLSHKSGIAARTQNMNRLLLVLVLALIAALAALIVAGISGATSANLARSYSAEAAEKFHSYIIQDLVLVKKASRSHAVTTWFADEGNLSKQIAAYNEMMDYATMLQGTRVYFGINKSMNDYYFDQNTALEDFSPIGRLEPSNASDSWYFDCIRSENDYTLNMDVDKFSQAWSLWINHKVEAEAGLAGAFCSGLEIQPLQDSLFPQNADNRTRGVVIDKDGVIQMDSAFPKVYGEGGPRHILDESHDPAFALAMDAYLARADGFYAPNTPPEVIRLSKGPYGYASIMPVSGSDWSVVIFLDNHTLSGVLYLLPLLLVMLLAFLLYALASNRVLRRLVFLPLQRLTLSVSEAVPGAAIFGNDRDDEIGELSGTIQAMRDNLGAINSELRDAVREQQRQKQLLHMVNRMAAVLLTSEPDAFQSDMWGCMGMMAEAVDVDRVYIWKNQPRNGTLRATRLYEWTGRSAPRGAEQEAEITYGDIAPGWAETLARGECVNGLACDMPPAIQARLSAEGVLSLFVVPVFLRDQFWGFIGFDDCHRERVFPENEETILRSGGLLIAHALLRNEMTINLRAVAAKLEAVIVNYPGIIWCLDGDNVITLFNGLHLQELGIAPSAFEGLTLDAAMEKAPLLDILQSMRQAAAHEPRDWTSKSGNKVYHTRTTLITSENDGTTNMVGRIDDITEITRLQTELEAALKTAQEANQAKSDFLANMSHEMRTPLNTIVGLSELILGFGSLRDDDCANLEKIYNAGMTLLNIVNDILDISKVEAGKFKMNPVQYDLPSLINDTVTQSILYIGEKPIAFHLNIEENLPMRLVGDELRIKQILNNLLSNAFKYTIKGQVELGIRCDREGDDVWLTASVRDTGIGIRPRDLCKLFSVYNQVDARSNRLIRGTGLGLSITKRLVELMGGDISVESVYGKGSVFTARIRQRFAGEAVIGPEIVSNLRCFRYSEQKRMRTFQIPRISLSYARVLVVDDVPSNLDVSKGMLRLYGMQTDCVTSGQQAINAIRDAKVRYNAIFMDHMMPEMDGIEAVRIIRQEIGTEYAKTIPIIALTANALVGNEEMFLRNGFQAFLPKPISIGRLDAILRQWVRDKKLEQLTRENQGKPSLIQMTPPRLFPWHVEGVDLQKGFMRLGYDEGSFEQALRVYAATVRELMGSVAEVRPDGLADYAIIAHGIHGASLGIGADDLGGYAKAMEKAAKEGDFAYVSAHNPSFIEAAGKLLGDLDGMLEEMALKHPKPKKDKPDAKALARLLSACERYHMGGADAAIAELDAYAYESGGGLVAWLKDNVNQMNFAQIKERLKVLGKETEAGEW